MTSSEELARRLVEVGGVVGVMLGGSRARGTHHPDSDVDLGVYYRPPLDVDGLAALAHGVAGPGATRTRPGDWGPWVDGGAWLAIDGVAVDWVYRDVDRVATAWRHAQEGRVAWQAQVEHPLGVLDVWYAAEVALGVVLADPTGVLTRLHTAAAVFPDALAGALVARLPEAGSRWPSRARRSGAATSPTSRVACSARSGCARTRCTRTPAAGW